MIKLTWDAEKGEGEVKIEKEFLFTHRMVQLDALVDWIAELSDIYQEMMKEKK